MRLPALAAGCGLVALGAALALRWLPPFQACLVAGLISLSPYLVYLSQVARVYSLLLLAYAVAVWQIFRWIGGGPDRALVVGAACAAIAALLHPSTLPSVATLAATPLVATLLRGEGRRWRGLAIGLATFGVGIAGALGVQAETLEFEAGLRRGLGSPDSGTMRGAMMVALGLPVDLPVWVWAGLALLGAARLARTHALASAWFVATLGAQLGGLFYTRPLGVEICWLFLRYAVHVLPFLLVALVIAVSPPSRWLGRRQTVAVVAASAVVLSYAASHAVAGRYGLASGAYANHPMAMFVPKRLSEAARALLPTFYTEVLPTLPAGALIEAPFISSFPLYGIYQRVHGREVYSGALGPRPPQPIFRERDGLRLRRTVDLGAGRLPSGHPARYLVVHKRLSEELPPVFRYFEAHPATRAPLRFYGRLHTRRMLLRKFGEGPPPLDPAGPDGQTIVYEDPLLVVYDLAGRPGSGGAE